MRSEVSFAFPWKAVISLLDFTLSLRRYLQFRILVTYFINLKSTMLTIKSFLAMTLMLSTASCFIMPRTEIISSNRNKLPTFPRRILRGSSSTNLSADVTFAIEKLPSMSKNIVIVLAFGGGESVLGAKWRAEKFVGTEY